MRRASRLRNGSLSLSLSLFLSRDRETRSKRSMFKCSNSKRNRLRPKCKSFAYDQWSVKLTRSRVTYIYDMELYSGHTRSLRSRHVLEVDLSVLGSIVNSLGLLGRQSHDPYPLICRYTNYSASRERNAIEKRHYDIVTYAWQSA